MTNLSKEFQLAAGKKHLSSLINHLLLIEKAEPDKSMGHIADAIDAMKVFVQAHSNGCLEDVHCTSGIFGTALVNACSDHMCEVVEEEGDSLYDEGSYVNYTIRTEENR